LRRIRNPFRQIHTVVLEAVDPTIHLIEHREELSKKFGIALLTLWPPSDEPCPPEMKFQTGHAGMNETSIMMALHNDLFRMKNLPKDLNEWPLGIGGQIASSVCLYHIVNGSWFPKHLLPVESNQMSAAI